MNASPSNAVLVLEADGARLRVAPHLGGRITECDLMGPDGRARPVLYPYPEGQLDLNNWGKGGIYPLVPYGGRMRDAAVAHGGRSWRLEPHAGSRHSLHGIAQRRPWTLVTADERSAHLLYCHSPDAHWPWAFTAQMLIALEPRALRVKIELTNLDEFAMPGGIGLHPYLIHASHEPIHYKASEPWPFDEDYLALPFAPLDACDQQTLMPSHFNAGEVTLFHGLWRGALHVLDSRNGLPRLSLQAGGGLTQLVIHRPAQSAYICVEPVSHVPDGVNLAALKQIGTGVITLEPGQSLSGTMTIFTSFAS